MKQYPILFSTPMVQAVMAGNKTQTRRIVTKHRSGPCQSALKKHLDWSVIYPNNPYGIKVPILEVLGYHKHETLHRVYPPYEVGDQLWVRETFTSWNKSIKDDNGEKFAEYPVYIYKADKLPYTQELFKWKPSIFMPKEASRIILEVTDIMVERLTDISEEDAITEGVFPFNPQSSTEPHRLSFCFLWEHINGKGSWRKNPWVWVVAFKRIES